MLEAITEYLDTVICDDVINILKRFPDSSIDLCITSPPYNKGEKNKGWLVANVKYSGASDKLPEDLYQQSQINFLNETYRVIKPGGSLFYNHKIRWGRGRMLHPMDWIRQTQWTVRQEIIWDRGIAANIRGWRFWQVDERIYWLYKPIDGDLIGKELDPKHAKFTSIWRIPPERNSSHPAPFPLQLPARIIYSILDEGNGIVLDPYCGSGTTLVAAKLLGHHFIGIDISAEYVDYAKKRLENCESEREIVLKEINLHKIAKTFADRKINKEYLGPNAPRNLKNNTN